MRLSLPVDAQRNICEGFRVAKTTIQGSKGGAWIGGGWNGHISGPEICFSGLEIFFSGPEISGEIPFLAG